ncbi:MAG: TIGR03435 family protein [Acidobacteria bacterium]|nr:TIGR03435 family protein [Acidobacteriota bacterium]
MSERFFSLLVRFYPARFRQAYGEEAVRFVLDRARDERGLLVRLRLLVDLFLDLVVTISRTDVWQEVPATSLHPVDGALSWRFLKDEAPHPAALATGAFVSLALLGALSASFSPIYGVTRLPVLLGLPQSPPHRPERQVAQQAPASNQTKERQEHQQNSVASIKPAKPGDRRRPGMEFLPGGRFRLTNMPLFVVLATAYQIPFQSREALEQRIRGIPDWMFAVPYDMEVVATGQAPPATAAKARNERIRLMLQSLLADRLQLRIRRESTEMAVYALMVGSRGIKLERAKVSERDCAEAAPFGSLDLPAPGCHQFLGGSGRGLRGTAVDLADLAAYVSNWSELPVIDQTGLSGLYQIQTEGWGSSQDSSGRTLDEVLDSLGLKLARKKARLEVLVIEHVERPSEN